jgi:hypothetical protein
LIVRIEGRDSNRCFASCRHSESLSDDKPGVQTIQLSEFRSGANISWPDFSFDPYVPSDIRIPVLILDDHALRSMPLITEILQAPAHSITRERIDSRYGDGAEIKGANILGSEDKHNVPQRYLDSFFGPVSLSIDRAESGMPFHQGRHCWVDLLSGSRRWLMFPPGRLPEPGFNPYAPTSDWLRDREVYRAITPTVDDTLIEAWQQPGQVQVQQR